MKTSTLLQYALYAVCVTASPLTSEASKKVPKCASGCYQVALVTSCLTSPLEPVACMCSKMDEISEMKSWKDCLTYWCGSEADKVQKIIKDQCKRQ